MATMARTWVSVHTMVITAKSTTLAKSTLAESTVSFISNVAGSYILKVFIPVPTIGIDMEIRHQIRYKKHSPKDTTYKG